MTLRTPCVPYGVLPSYPVYPDDTLPLYCTDVVC